MGRVKEEMAVNIPLLVLDSTAKAVFVKSEVGGTAWLPKSVIVENEDFQIGFTYDCTLPEWIAEAKGLNNG